MIVTTIDGQYVKPPYYVLDEMRLVENYTRLKKAFSFFYDRFIIAYSYKANYVPYMCKKLHKLGAYAEVSSRLEYDLACRLISSRSKVIFNGPVKSYSDLEVTLKNKSIVNLDSFYEIDHVKKYCRTNPRATVNVGLRLNFAMSGEKGLRFKTSRFGFCYENGDFEKAISKIKGIPNVKIICLHAHFSTKTRSLSIFKEITSRLCEIALQILNGKVQYIDIGGNFGRAPKEMNQLKFPSFDEYARIIIGELKKYITIQFKPYLIIEPGIALVGDAYDFVCNVVEVKKVRNKRFIVLDGGVHNIKPTMHKFNIPVRVFDRKGSIKSGNDYTYQVVGYTCMETDYLIKNFKGPEIKIGDFFVFSNVGAYTIVLNPPFIQPHPPIIVRKNNKYKIIRRAETFGDFFSTYELK